MEKKMENGMETGIIKGLYWGYSIFFRDTMVPIIEYNYILLLGYSTSYKEYNLTRFYHQKNSTHLSPEVTSRLVLNDW